MSRFPSRISHDTPRASPSIDDEESEFSYAASDTFNNPAGASQYSTDEPESQYSSHYSTPGFQPPAPKASFKDSAVRDSYASNFSEYSGHANQVAQPVSVTVVNQPVVPTVNRSLSTKKLNTTAGASGKMQPDMVYSTAIENSVPPRSNRRPKSEVVDTSRLKKEVQQFKGRKGHNKRVSLAISDDLDKLMQRANSLQSQTYTFREVSSESSGSRPVSRSSEREQRKDEEPQTEQPDLQPATEPNLQPESSFAERQSNLQPEQLQKPQQPDPTALAKRGSSESFKTASVHSDRSDTDTVPPPAKDTKDPETMAKPYTNETIAKPYTKTLPPRPSNDNLIRSRQVSSQMEKRQSQSQESLTSKDRIYQTLPQPPLTSDDESHYSDDILDTSGTRASMISGLSGRSLRSQRSIGLGISKEGEDQVLKSNMLVSDDPNEFTQTPPDQIHQFDQDQQQFEDQNQFGSSYENREDQFGQYETVQDDHPLPPLPQSKGFYDYSPKGEFSDFVKPKQVFDDENNSSNFSDRGYPARNFEETSLTDNSPVHPSFGEVKSGASEGVSGAASGTLRGTNSTGISPKDEADQFQSQPQFSAQNQPQLDPNAKNLKTPDVSNITQAPAAPAKYEDEFYDIDDPVLVAKPSRGKSVKESTKHPRKMKRKASKRKSKRESSNQLKPFSYHTLINLLESINGTIIGEEFNQLNLPIKEKQLIEKIVDQLSRLTSDMVLDEQRYEIGIDRLERALRVLEGFM